MTPSIYVYTLCGNMTGLVTMIITHMRIRYAMHIYNRPVVKGSVSSGSSSSSYNRQITCVHTQRWNTDTTSVNSARDQVSCAYMHTALLANLLHAQLCRPVFLSCSCLDFRRQLPVRWAWPREQLSLLRSHPCRRRKMLCGAGPLAPTANMETMCGCGNKTQDKLHEHYYWTLAIVSLATNSSHV